MVLWVTVSKSKIYLKELWKIRSNSVVAVSQPTEIHPGIRAQKWVRMYMC